MIKIIKKGKRKNNIVNYKIFCEYCDTIFCCTEDDLKTKVIAQGMKGDFITCPVCKHELDLTSNFDCVYETF